MNLPISSTSTTNITVVAQNQSATNNTPAPLDSSLDPILRGIQYKWRINQIIGQDEAQQIVTGVKIVDLTSSEVLVNHNTDTEQFAASINKLPVALLVLQDLRAGKLSMNQLMTWVPSDRRDGGGIYDVPGAPTQATLSDVLFDMLNRSGNTAVRVLVNYGLGGAAAVNARWAQIPQLSHTYLMPLDASRFYLGNSTPHDALWTLGQDVSVQDTFGKFVTHALATNIYTDIGTRSQLAGNDYIVLVNKLGLLNDPSGDNRHDVGIIYNTKTHKSYGYAYMTTSPESNTAATPQAEQSLKDMGLATLRYAGDKPKEPTQNTPHMNGGLSPTIPEGKILY